MLKILFADILVQIPYNFSILLISYKVFVLFILNKLPLLVQVTDTSKGSFYYSGNKLVYQSDTETGRDRKKIISGSSIFSTGRDQRRVYAADSRSRGNGKENHL